MVSMLFTMMSMVFAFGMKYNLAASVEGYVEMENKIGRLARPDFVKQRRARGSQSHEVFIAVKQLNMNVLEESALSRNTPGSPLYQQWMTSEEVAAVRNNAAGTSAIKGWLTDNGVEITWEGVNGLYLKAETTIGHWESLLKTTFHMYQDQKEASFGHLLPRAATYFIPESISDHVHAFFGVAELPAAINHHSRKLAADRKHPEVAVERHVLSVDKNRNLRARKLTGACDGDSTIACLNQVYEVDSNIGIAAATQAVLELQDETFSQNDLTAFQIEFNATIQAALVDGTTPANVCTFSDCGEGNLDIQYIMGMAQVSVATFYHVTGADPFLVYLQDLASMTNPYLVTSISWSGPESDYTSSQLDSFNQEAIVVANMGSTIIAASGDNGASGGYGCEANSGSSELQYTPQNGSTWSGEGYSPQFPVTNPYVTAVGATMGPEANDPVVACQANEGGMITSGGGFSSYWETPPWQQTQVTAYFNSATADGTTPSPGYNPMGRGYPDVAMLGVNFPIVIGGKTELVWGTSASSPLFASLVSLINSARLTTHPSARGLGWLNPTLYAAAATVSFVDITSGDNKCTEGDSPYPPYGATCCTSGFTCTVGWDPVSGLGSITLPALSTVLSALSPDATAVPSAAPTSPFPSVAPTAPPSREPQDSFTYSLPSTSLDSMVIASGDNGVKLYAGTPYDGESQGQYDLYTSTNSGGHWSAMSSVPTQFPWTSVFASQTGDVFTIDSNTFQRSVNDGRTWTPISTSTTGTDWLQVVCSQSGKYVLASKQSGANVQLYMSKNAGDGFKPVGDPIANLTTLAMSATGEYMAALRQDSNNIYVSSDHGETWAARDVLPAGDSCENIFIGPSGQWFYLTACYQLVGTEKLDMNVILVSSDFGEEFTNMKAPVLSWRAVTTDLTNGAILVATSSSSMYRSLDQGHAGTMQLVDASSGWDAVISDTVGNQVIATKIGTSANGVYIGTFSSGTQRRTQAADDDASVSRVLGVVDTVSALTPSNPVDFTWVDMASSMFYTDIASSNTSMNLAATTSGSGIYLSSNGGSSWSLSSADTSANWQCISSSASGQYLVAADESKSVQYSSDYGASWSNATGIPHNMSNPVTGLASSGSGQYVTAVASYEMIYHSSDYGASFIAAASGNPSDGLGSYAAYKPGAVSMSASGETQTVVAYNIAGGLYLSTDYGVSWSPSTDAAVTALSGFSAVCMSADGTTIVAASLLAGGSFVVSTDAGASFTNTGTSGSLGLTATPISIGLTMSADGVWLAAAVDPGSTTGYMYLSNTTASSWNQASASMAQWGLLASSADFSVVIGTQSDASIQPLVMGYPTPPDTTSSSGGGNSELSDVEIGVIFGGVIAVVIVGVLIWWYCMKPRFAANDELSKADKSDLMTGIDLRSSQ